MAERSNICAGPFAAVYDVYIERPWLAQAIGRAVWGIDIAPLYASMEAIGRVPDGATILDVPCGGGVALRALRPDQRVRYVAADLSEQQLARCRRRAGARSLDQVEPMQADMCALPLADASVDLCLAYSGLHIVPDPAAAVAELVRCLKPGGELVGTTFLSEGSRRQRRLFELGWRRGLNGPCGTAAELRGWLEAAGIEQPSIAPERGVAVVRGRKRAGLGLAG
jgi:SAM-dependent methyltransferase